VNFIVGFILGLIVSAVGFTGIAQALDNGLNAIKNVSIQVEEGKQNVKQ
jgi:hypothetical protein